MFRKLTPLAVVLLVVACGGGGSAPATTAPANLSAEGIWNGTTSTGLAVSLAVLENGETWGLYGSSNTISGAIFGSTATNGSSVSMSGNSFDFVNRLSSPGTLTGSVVSKSALNVVSSAGTSVSAVYSASYDQTASLAALAGTYSGQAVSASTLPQATTVTISVTGAVSAVVTGCTTSGSAIPRPTGKNIFNISVTSVGPLCALGNGTLTTGIAHFNPTRRQLIAMALNSAKSDGFVYSGTR